MLLLLDRLWRLQRHEPHPKSLQQNYMRRRYKVVPTSLTTDIEARKAFKALGVQMLD
jgi:hypothetical protein